FSYLRWVKTSHPRLFFRPRTDQLCICPLCALAANGVFTTGPSRDPLGQTAFISRNKCPTSYRDIDRKRRDLGQLCCFAQEWRNLSLGCTVRLSGPFLSEKSEKIIPEVSARFERFFCRFF